MEKNKKLIIGVIVVVALLLIIGLMLFFTNKTYTVTFDAKGGTEIASQTVNKNETVAKPKDPTREGYIFLGWYVNEESTVDYDFSNKIDKDITLIAKWEKEEESVTTVSILTEKSEITVNDELTLSAKVMKGDKEVENTELVWTSSDEKIATVDKTGKVKALKSGKVTITATVNGVKSEIKLNIKEKAVQTSAKPVSNNKKPNTTKPTTGGNTKPQTKVTYSYKWEKIDSSVAGQYMLYIVSSNGKKVAGTVTLTTISGTSSTVSIPASGAIYVKDAIKSVSNVKAAK